jgi:RND superfamily putative drug exporter
MTMRTAGRTVFFSGLTVILSLLGLLIFPIGFLRSMGLGASAAVAVAVVGALTALPAVLSILGYRVDAWAFGRVRADYKALRSGQVPLPRGGHSRWYRAAQWAMRWPVLTIGLIVIPLVFMGQFFLRATFSSADYRSLPVGVQSRDVAVALVNDFPGGNSNPVQVVAQVPTGPQMVAELANYQDALHRLPGVQGVTIRRSGDWVLLNVSYNSDYDQQLARDLVADARGTAHPAGWSVKVGGSTANLVDLLAVIRHYAVYAVLVVALALVVLLFIMLRSLVIPLQALFVNFLSLTATFGVLVWIFQEGHLSKWLGFTAVGSVDATQPVLIFGIAFGLSMDYSVFLLSRVKEQYDQDHDIRESVASGVAKTGPIITSAAVLFIVVVAAFATSAIPLIKQIGVGLGLAVFIDAFLVRTLLVPAIMVLFGRGNWWPGAAWRRTS